MKSLRLLSALLFFSVSLFAAGCGGEPEPYDEDAGAGDTTELSEEEISEEPGVAE